LTSTSEISPEVPLVENRRQRLERLLQIATHDTALHFEFGNRDLVGESQIVMKAGASEVISASLPRLKGRAFNLLGHSLSGGWEWYEAALRQESLGKPGFASLWHALEDARVENQLIARWPGSAKYFQANLLPNLGGKLLSRMPVLEQLELGLYFEGRGFSGARFTRAVEDVIRQIDNEIFIGSHGESTQNSYQAMLLMYPIISNLIQLGSALNSGLHRDGDQELSNEAQGIEDQQSTALDGAVPEFSEEEGLVVVGTGGQPRQFPEWYRPGSAPWFERDLGKKEIHPSAVRTNRQTIVEPPKGDADVYWAVRREIQGEAGYLSHRLTNIIREEIYLRYAGYYRTGRLNKAKLWKQRIGNYRLFQRLVTGIGQMVAFTLLVDESASMKGQEKYRMAMKAALLFGETLNFLHTPFEIIGFTTEDYEARAAMKLGLLPASDYRTMRCSPLEHRIYKRFDELYSIARFRLTGIEPRHNNWDEEHLMFAFQRIQARPERRKVIIILCDGQPNGDANYLIDVVKRIESTGCKLIGVGIGSEFVKEIYPSAIVVSDFRQLVDELFHVLAGEFRASLV